jgi:hypothetical protein
MFAVNSPLECGICSVSRTFLEDDLILGLIQYKAGSPAIFLNDDFSRTGFEPISFDFVSVSCQGSILENEGLDRRSESQEKATQFVPNFLIKNTNQIHRT